MQEKGIARNVPLGKRRIKKASLESVKCRGSDPSSVGLKDGIRVVNIATNFWFISVSYGVVVAATTRVAANPQGLKREIRLVRAFGIREGFLDRLLWKKP
jgi:hypothetical protein